MPLLVNPTVDASSLLAVLWCSFSQLSTAYVAQLTCHWVISSLPLCHWFYQPIFISAACHFVAFGCFTSAAFCLHCHHPFV